jgi:hypothetical protein
MEKHKDLRRETRATLDVQDPDSIQFTRTSADGKVGDRWRAPCRRGRHREHFSEKEHEHCAEDFGGCARGGS